MVKGHDAPVSVIVGAMLAVAEMWNDGTFQVRDFTVYNELLATIH